MRFMICYRIKNMKTMPEPEFFDTFQEAVIRYTELCTGTHNKDWDSDVVLTDLQNEKIIRHFSFRCNTDGVAVTSY